MYKKLQFKIVLILVSFIISVMTVVGTILIGSIFSYFTNDFLRQQNEVFTNDFKKELSLLLDTETSAEQINGALMAHSARLGIDSYRNYYVLDEKGDYLSGSTDEKSADIRKTENLLSAISGTSAHRQSVGNSVMDYAERISSNSTDKSVIIYVCDTKEEMKEFSWMVFSILLQSLLIGLGLALVLSFFLSKAITSPIQKITEKATSVAEGNFDEKLVIYSNDEIGTLTETFNKMAEDLENNLKEISSERRKLETIFFYLKDAVIAFDNVGNPMHINPTARFLFGIETNDFTLANLISCLNLDSLENEECIDENDALTLSNVIYRDKVFDVSFGKFRFSLSDDTFGGYIAVLHDITERFELEKSRREFIANVSHELGTPLTSIKGAAETIVTNPEMPHDVQEHFLQMVIGESDRMSHIVKDLLVLSRLDNNRMMWNASSFSLPSLISHCVDVVKGEAEKNGQELIYVNNEKELPNIEADRERVEQILINLIQNAVKYTQNNGKVMVSFDFDDTFEIENLSAGEYFTVKVSDNGIGIPKEDLPHIFERFYRVEKARNSDKGGTGLGLAIAKEIAIEHGGDIRIESVYKKGTTVTLHLPKKAKFIEQ